MTLMEDRKRMNATRHQGDALEDVGAALGEEHAAEGRAMAQHGGAQEDADEHVGDGAELAKAVEHQVLHRSMLTGSRFQPRNRS